MTRDEIRERAGYAGWHPGERPTNSFIDAVAVACRVPISVVRAALHEPFDVVLKATMDRHDVDERTVAFLCGVSLPTVERWLAGAIEPHDLIIDAILKCLEG